MVEVNTATYTIEPAAQIVSNLLRSVQQYIVEYLNPPHHGIVEYTISEGIF